MTDQLDVCAALGSRALLDNVKLGLFCSVHCPGKLIVRTYDLVRELRDAGVTLVGGFHSPMEQECLRLVLHGGSPMIVCPARSVQDMRLLPEWKAPLQAGRLLLISPFPSSLRRVTHETAMCRNAFVANLADVLFVAYATPGGSIERLCRDALHHGKHVLTFNMPENQHLAEFGAEPALDAASVIRAIGRWGRVSTLQGFHVESIRSVRRRTLERVMLATVRRLESADAPEHLRMRHALWPDADVDELAAEIEPMLTHPDQVVFVAPRADGGLSGFVEAGVRAFADGVDESPCAFVEGWWVDADARRGGIGRALIAAVESWARERGFHELGSNAELDNVVSHRAHEALGFEERERVVYFRKML